MAFAKTLPTVKEQQTNKSLAPTVLIFGAQATKGILKEDHPYVRLTLIFLFCYSIVNDLIAFPLLFYLLFFRFKKWFLSLITG
jgi:hypothetical protein